MDQKALAQLEGLQRRIAEIGPCVVAFSGGADSTFLAAVATRVLGAEHVHCVTAVSPSLARSEFEECGTLADVLGLNWTTVDTDEMERAAYGRNDRDRCFHCKSALMDALTPIAAEKNATVLLGVNLDDLGDERPGQIAAEERGALFPMVDARLTKADIRNLSREIDIPTWDKPAMACLASRVPNGIAVTVEVLSRVERAESFIRSLGVRGNLRVRHFNGIACIEVDPEEFPLITKCKEVITAHLGGLGYERVVLDLDGFRSGSLSRIETGFGARLMSRQLQDLLS